MAHSCCADLSAGDRLLLLRLARDTLHHGLVTAQPPQPDLAEIPGALRERRAVFVTLSRGGNLRGCIGSLRASAPLAWAVVDAAHGAGFRDPRFPCLRAEELAATRIEISVLSPLEQLAVGSRDELFATLRPQHDGLLLHDGKQRATFLPKVWQQLPDRHQFLDQLLLKAGLPKRHWSADLQFYRYQAATFGEAEFAPG